jgi:hypothetical protein
MPVCIHTRVASVKPSVCNDVFIHCAHCALPTRLRNTHRHHQSTGGCRERDALATGAIVQSTDVKRSETSTSPEQLVHQRCTAQQQSYRCSAASE